MFTFRNSLRIAAFVGAFMLFQFMTSSAEAGHRHRFHRHHRHHIGWSSFGGYGSFGGFRHWGGWHHAWHYRPSVYFYRPAVRYYRVRYAPIDYCYGWGDYYYSRLSNGYGYGWLGSNSPSRRALPSAQPRALASDVLIAKRAIGTSSKIVMNLDVPDDARVFINELETKTTGGSRSYVSKGVETDASYEFVIRAEVERGGEVITETKTVRLQGGQTSSLAFNLDQPQTELLAAQEPVDTTLKLRVPDGAQVFLSDSATKQTGAERRFVTQQLGAGEKWEDYRIRVTWNDGDRQQTREKKITLVAGETRELEFFGESRMVAAR